MARGRPTCSGLIIAGPPSAQDSGEDAALLRVEGMRVVDRVVQHLRPLCDDVTVIGVARRVNDLPAGVRSIEVPAGPLSRVLAAGLRAAAHELVAVLDAAAPTPDTTLLERLGAAWAGEPAVVPSSEAGPEPLHAMWTRGSAAALDEIADPALDADALRWLGATVLDVLATASFVSHDRWTTSSASGPPEIDLR